MGKTRTIEGKQKHKSTKKQDDRRSPTDLLDQAAVFLEQSEADAALPLAKGALSQLESLAQPDPELLIQALVLVAQVNLELGEAETARTHCLRADILDPDGEVTSAEPSLWLAQLSEEGGNDSIRWFEKGVNILKDEIRYLEELGPADVEAQVVAADKKLRAAEALCSMAEVYMTDLSFEDDAEARCETYVTEALLLAPNSPSTLQTLASVRISQTREDEARKALERSIDLWQDLPAEDPGIPEFATRVSLVRLLMEVGMESKAFEVLQRLVLEDDESVETWYLGGWCQYLQAEKGEDTKEPAREWLRTCLKLYRIQDYEDERLKEHAAELVASLDSQLGGSVEDEDDDGWEDADEDGGSDFEGFPDNEEVAEDKDIEMTM